MTDLAALLGGVRLVEPRFSGGFEHAPCVPFETKGRLIPAVQCAPYPEAGTAAAEALADLGRRFEEQAASTADPRALHARAVQDALSGATRAARERRDYFLGKKAIPALERLRRAFPRNPLVFNDLAAAYLLRAFATDEPAELVQALDLIEQAYALDSRRPEILFNRALILDRLFLVFSAKRAWAEAAALEASGGWREEAEAHLAALSLPSVPERWEAVLPELERAALAGDQKQVRAIVEIDRQRAREFATEDKLGAWGDLYLSGNGAGAVRELAVAGAVGEALAASGGDRTAIEAWSRMAGLRDGPSLAALARGHRAYRDAVQGFRQWNNGALAEAALKPAAANLEKGGSPLALWADEWSARAIAYQSRYPEALDLHRAVQARARGRGYPALEGFVGWGACWALNRWKGSAFALGEGGDAYRHLAAAGEREGGAAVRSLIGDALFRLGQGEMAYRDWYAALQGLASTPRSLRRHNTFLRFGDQASESGLRFAALALRREQKASTGDDPVQISETLYHLGEMLVESGHVREGLAEVGLAAAVAAGISKDGSGRKLQADVWAVQGRVLRRSDPAAAIEPLSQAIEYFAADGSVKPDEVSNRTERALALAALGRFAEAREDLDRAFAILEERRRSIGSFDLRSTFEEAFQGAYDAAIEVEWSWHRDPAQAFTFLERARGGLDDLVLPSERGHRSARGLREIAQRLPPEVPVVEFAVLPHSLLTWTFYRGECRFAARALEARILSEEVRDYVARVIAGARASELAPVAQRLAAILLPKEVWTESADVPVVLIPDKILHSLPFAALQHPGTGRFLVEARPLLFAPNLAAVLDASRNPTAPFDFEAPALLIGNPAIDRKRFPRLDDLPGALREIRQAARRFRRPQILLEAEATKPAVLQALGEIEVLVFAGHSVAQASHPGQSYLLLAPENPLRAGSSPALLFAEEIGCLRLPRLRTVILSSCSSAGPREARVSGLAGLARPFLDAGATTVLGALWRVADRPQAHFLARLFARLGDREPLVSALRKAQVEALRSGSEANAAPSVWSGIEILARGMPLQGATQKDDTNR